MTAARDIFVQLSTRLPFKILDLAAKQAKVQQLSLCFNCLGNSHLQSECPSTHSCAVCQQRHHTCLHDTRKNAREMNPRRNAPTATTSSTQPPTASQSALNVNAQSFHLKADHSSPKTVILGTAKVLIINKGVTYSARPLLDSASEASFITDSLRKRLGLLVQSTNATILGVDRRVSATSSKICAFQLQSAITNQPALSCTAYVLLRITGKLPACSISISNCPIRDSMQLADDHFHESTPVDLLLGGDIYPSLVLNGVQHNVFGHLLAQKTIFGWVLTGTLPCTNVRRHITSVAVHHSCLDISGSGRNVKIRSVCRRGHHSLLINEKSLRKPRNNGRSPHHNLTSVSSRQARSGLNSHRN